MRSPPAPSAKAAPSAAAQLQAETSSSAPAPARRLPVVESPSAIEPMLHADGKCPYALYSPRGAVIVNQCGNDLMLLRDGKLEPAVIPTTGLGVRHLDQAQGEVESIQSVTGRWPDALVIESTNLHYEMGDRGAFFYPEEAAYELVGGRWREIAANSVFRAAAWSQGRTLVHRGGEFALLAGRKDLGLPKRATGSRCGYRVTVQDFVALSNGTVAAVGRDCDSRDSNAILVELMPENAAARVLELRTQKSLVAKARPRILGENERGLFVMVPGSAGPALFRLEGESFVELEFPSKRPLAAAHASPSGQLWLVFGGATPKKGKAEPYEVMRWSLPGAWESLKLPDEASLRKQLGGDAGTSELRFLPDSLASFGEGEVWLAGSVVEGVDRHRAALLARVRAESAAPAPRVGARPGPEVPRPFSAECASPFVLLYSVAANVPSDYSFPATRDAVLGTRFLTSATFVEFDHAGKRTLGALVASRADGEELVGRIAQNVKGSKPALMCFAPKSVLREVSLR